MTEVDDDVLDAIGELANTVGGNFKGLFSADTTLPIPEIFKVNQSAEPDAQASRSQK
ncbi:MAG: chemotaxis protein CheX [Janthinobacterium lividum]